jgi:hypothetical protein
VATLILDTPRDVPFFTLRTRLDDKDFILDFSYNHREEAFYMSVLDSEEQPLALGVKVITNVSLLRWFFGDQFPAGDLVAASTTTDKSQPKLGELGIGRRCELTYYEPA